MRRANDFPEQYSTVEKSARLGGRLGRLVWSCLAPEEAGVASKKNSFDRRKRTRTNQSALRSAGGKGDAHDDGADDDVDLLFGNEEELSLLGLTSPPGSARRRKSLSPGQQTTPDEDSGNGSGGKKRARSSKRT